MAQEIICGIYSFFKGSNLSSRPSIEITKDQKRKYVVNIQNYKTK